MDVTLHVGPHKTGTTAIQQTLVSLLSGCPVEGFAYPKPRDYGPGHAILAWSILGKHGRPASMAALDDFLRAELPAGATHAVLSSEEFATTDPVALDVLAQALRPHRVHVVVTLSPVRRRFVAEWQEMVKHGWGLPMARSLKAVRARPGLQPGFVPRLLRILAPERATAIMIDRAEPPEALYRHFLDVLGLSALVDRLAPNDTIANASLREFDIEVLRSFNIAFFGTFKSAEDQDRYMPMRDVLLETFRTQRWAGHSKPLSDVMPNTMPDGWQDTVTAVAEQTLTALRILVTKRRMAMVGDLDLLVT